MYIPAPTSWPVAPPALAPTAAMHPVATAMSQAFESLRNIDSGHFIDAPPGFYGCDITQVRESDESEIAHVAYWCATAKIRHQADAHALNEPDLFDAIIEEVEHLQFASADFEGALKRMVHAINHRPESLSVKDVALPALRGERLPRVLRTTSSGTTNPPPVSRSVRQAPDARDGHDVPDKMPMREMQEMKTNAAQNGAGTFLSIGNFAGTIVNVFNTGREQLGSTLGNAYNAAAKALDTFRWAGTGRNDWGGVSPDDREREPLTESREFLSLRDIR
ncbi:hypothetical protein PCA31118_03247 [Pandoraea captiosa]|uniref:Uncharacterized protein n=2 Tax=Pandoraea captiosa TaxID=2508302 RepID=A0A5E5A7G4_9BURK|nr:hypothetical protein PCA31118_03247 [Pandoraea captiosa]